MKVIVLLLALAGLAYARPGGGHSFSGGHSYSHSSSHSYSGGSHSYSSGHSSSYGHSYSSGGGISGQTIVYFLLIVLVVVIVFLVLSNRRTRPVYTPEPALDLGPLLARDPDFSKSVFEDFAYQLYSAARRADADGLKKLAPYLSPDAMAAIGEQRAEQVVVGWLHVDAARTLESKFQLAVRIESNLSAAAGTAYVIERWLFTRDLDAATKPPATRTWPCPNCGAPWQAAEDPRTCAHCGEPIRPGKFDWAVSAITVDSVQHEGKTLTGTVEEQGNDKPTIAEAGVFEHLGALTGDDPEVRWETLQPRVRMIYGRLNDAWNASELAPVRGLVTGSLGDYLRYWLDEYRRQGLANHLTDAQITRLDLAKVDRDKWYDAITVRVFATGHDFTTRGDKVVGGSKTAFRPYTEYWTFLRSSARRGPIKADPACPNCGAALAISDAGTCTHCNAFLENGSFDWVLSKIEQDDVYEG
jgi:hypothetical protein